MRREPIDNISRNPGIDRRADRFLVAFVERGQPLRITAARVVLTSTMAIRIDSLCNAASVVAMAARLCPTNEMVGGLDAPSRADNASMSERLGRFAAASALAIASWLTFCICR